MMNLYEKIAGLNQQKKSTQDGDLNLKKVSNSLRRTFDLLMNRKIGDPIIQPRVVSNLGSSQANAPENVAIAPIKKSMSQHSVIKENSDSLLNLYSPALSVRQRRMSKYQREKYFNLYGTSQTKGVSSKYLSKTQETFRDKALFNTIQKTVKQASQKFNVDEKYIWGIMKAESNFNPKARSHVGAEGLMQLMPQTAKYLGVKNSYDVKENIMGGVKYFKEMMDKFGNKPKLALAAYNAGPGAVKKYKGIPPYKETQNYVTKIMKYVSKI